MAAQICKSWSVVTASMTAFALSLMWIYFSEVRPLSAEHNRRHPEPTHFS